MSRVPGPYVVVGASGILAPLGLLLRSRGLRTVGISRGDRSAEGAWDERVALDTQDVAAVTGWVARRPGDVAAVVAYSPAVAPPCWPLLAGLAEHVVVVATTGWAASAAPTEPWSDLPAVAVVQLGWARTADGSRWHTPDEVSAAVAGVLAGARMSRTVLVGSIRPWRARPR